MSQRPSARRTWARPAAIFALVMAITSGGALLVLPGHTSTAAGAVNPQAAAPPTAVLAVSPSGPPVALAVTAAASRSGAGSTPAGSHAVGVGDGPVSAARSSGVTPAYLCAATAATNDAGYSGGAPSGEQTSDSVTGSPNPGIGTPPAAGPPTSTPASPAPSPAAGSAPSGGPLTPALRLSAGRTNSLEITADASGTSGGFGALTYHFAFGADNGTDAARITSSSPHASRAYDDTGTATVTLTVTDASGASASTTGRCR